MSDTPVLNIWQRINAADRILSEASWQKNAKNDTYSSVPIDLMRTEISKVESEMGIVVHYDELDFGHMEHNGKSLCMIKARRRQGMEQVRVHHLQEPLQGIVSRRRKRGRP